MSTSLVGDECLWAAVFRRNGWLVVWILFLLVCGEETRGFFLVSARLLASPVSGCCVALRMVSSHGRGVSSVAHSLPQFFLHVVQSALGGLLVNSFRFYGLLHRHRSKRVKRKKKKHRTSRPRSAF